MKVVFTLASLKCLNFCLYTLIVPFMPLILSQNGLSPSWVGYIFAAYPLSTILFTPIFGHYITQIGRKRSLILGSVGQLIGCGLFLLLKYFKGKRQLIGLAIFARVVQGFSNALTQPSA
jgi:MFS transporter, DHA1 family, multidrug resistance protein